MNGKRILLVGGTVVTPSQVREHCDLLTENGQIVALRSLPRMHLGYGDAAPNPTPQTNRNPPYRGVCHRRLILIET